MAKYKLTYFDIDGGRAEPIRIAFHAAGIEFEDHRISFDEFSEMRSGARFTCVPVLENDGDQITQSNAISRYVGKMAGLYPADDLQALVFEPTDDSAHQASLHGVRFQDNERRFHGVSVLLHDQGGRIASQCETATRIGKFFR